MDIKREDEEYQSPRRGRRWRRSDSHRLNLVEAVALNTVALNCKILRSGIYRGRNWTLPIISLWSRRSCKPLIAIPCDDRRTLFYFYLQLIQTTTIFLTLTYARLFFTIPSVISVVITSTLVFRCQHRSIKQCHRKERLRFLYNCEMKKKTRSHAVVPLWAFWS